MVRGAGLQIPTAMLDDGVYGLNFESQDAGGPGDGAVQRAEGLAVLRGGRLLGSDRHGSIFRGCCRYDARRGEAVIEVRLALPPHGVLLTGLEAGPDGALIEVAGRFRPPRPVSSAVIDIGGAMVAVELRYVGPLS